MKHNELLLKLEELCKQYRQDFYLANSPDNYKRETIKYKIPKPLIEKPETISGFYWGSLVIIFIVFTIICSICYYFLSDEFDLVNVLIISSIISILIHILIIFYERENFEIKNKEYIKDKLRYDNEVLLYQEESYRVNKINNERIYKKDFYDQKCDESLEKIMNIVNNNSSLKNDNDFIELKSKYENIFRFAIENIRNYDLIKNVGTRRLKNEGIEETEEKFNFEEYFKDRKVQIFCPSCGYKFEYLLKYTGKTTGVITGAISGALLGAKTGIVAGPLGGIAGTIPGLLLGAFFGSNAGNNFDKPNCPKCLAKFSLPDNVELK